LQAIEGNTIGAMVRRDAQMSFGVKLEVEFSAATYCGAPNTLPETIKEGVRFITDQFGHLNLTEIREAFRLAAAKKIEADLSAFYGLFTIQLLGKVLAAYDDYRTAIFREVRAKVRNNSRTIRIAPKPQYEIRTLAGFARMVLPPSD